MESRKLYGVLRGFYETGTTLSEAMKLEKRQQLAYRFLSVVRTGKQSEFYNMLLKLYVGAKWPIPVELLSLLNPNDSIEFESKAYALLSGFLGEERSETSNDVATASSTDDLHEITPQKEEEENG